MIIITKLATLKHSYDNCIICSNLGKRFLICLVITLKLIHIRPTLGIKSKIKLMKVLRNQKDMITFCDNVYERKN